MLPSLSFFLLHVLHPFFLFLYVLHPFSRFFDFVPLLCFSFLFPRTFENTGWDNDRPTKRRLILSKQSKSVQSSLWRDLLVHFGGASNRGSHLHQVAASPLGMVTSKEWMTFNREIVTRE